MELRQMLCSFAQWLMAPRAGKGLSRVLIWWEVRRIPYNIVVLPFGLIGLVFESVMLDLCFPVRAADVEVIPFIEIMLGAITVNICYCAGCGLEIIATLCCEERARKIAPYLWLVGIGFSICMCMLPGLAELALFTVHRLGLPVGPAWSQQ